MKTKVEFLTGRAGTGKTYELKSRIHTKTMENGRQSRNYGTLCATTGIAAVNLSGATGDSVSTLNSELKFFDTNSLEENYAKGKLQQSLHKVLSKGANLCIDEISMMEAKQLDILYLALSEFNQLSTVEDRGGLGLVLTGDFCQLPPVEGEYAFRAQCWPEFADNITRLTHVWRQENVKFLEAINYAREGEGGKCGELLGSLDKESENRIFSSNLDTNFEGTTILPLNRDVDRFNNSHLLRLLENNKRISFKSVRWGQQRGEWKIIPDELVLTENSYVMILANNPPNFDYANGDCGYLRYGSEIDGTGCIQLRRNNKVVEVSKVCRRVSQTTTPDGMKDPEPYLDKKDFRVKYGRERQDIPFTKEDADFAYDEYLRELTNKDRRKGVPGCPFYDYKEEKWIMGEIIYTPLRLAYASTCHKTQGLTLDSIQIDPHNRFFGNGSMMYVALSRVRSHEGLRIVGDERLLESRVNIVEDVLRWI